MSVASTVEVGIADAAKALDTLESQYSSAKAQIVSVVQAHIDDHQKQIAAHAAEVAAAQTILSKAIPTATTTATQAAAFVLTAPGYVQRTVNFFGRNWRYAALSLSVVIVGYGIHAGLVHL
jgi:hypothetical protein